MKNFKRYIKKTYAYYEKYVPNYCPDVDDIVIDVALQLEDETGMIVSEDTERLIRQEVTGEI